MYISLLSGMRKLVISRNKNNIKSQENRQKTETKKIV